MLEYIVARVTASRVNDRIDFVRLGGAPAAAQLVRPLIAYGEPQVAASLTSSLRPWIATDWQGPRHDGRRWSDEAALLEGMCAGVDRTGPIDGVWVNVATRMASALVAEQHSGRTGEARLLVALRGVRKLIPRPLATELEGRTARLAQAASMRTSLLPRWHLADIRALSVLSFADRATTLFNGWTRKRLQLHHLPEAALSAYALGRWEFGDASLQAVDERIGYAAELDPVTAAQYLMANRCRVSGFFERIAPELPATVDPRDGRLAAVLDQIAPSSRVVEVGCGKGRFLAAVQSRIPTAVCVGVDLSPTLLAHVPSHIHTLAGVLEALPCRDDEFDVAFSIEAIEHSTNRPAAIRELIRVTKPGGWVIVVDKPWSKWGHLACPSWERWPSVPELESCLRDGCDDVTTASVSYDGRQADGLIVAWRGRKRPCGATVLAQPAAAMSSIGLAQSVAPVPRLGVIPRPPRLKDARRYPKVALT